MIKTLLKHKLAETAINTFFNKVSNNFRSIDIPNGKFKEGNKYVCIKTLNNDMFNYVYYQCEIIHMYDTNIHIKYKTGLIYQYVNNVLYHTTYRAEGIDIINIHDINNIHDIIQAIS